MDELPRRQRFRLPELLLGLVALAIAVPVTGVVAANAVRDVKRSRDTIVVTGSAKQPITADLALWHLSTYSQERTPQQAVRSVRAKAAQVEAFLRSSGLGADAVTKPPIGIQETSVSVPTGLKKPKFRKVPEWRVSQGYEIETREIDKLESAAGHIGDLLLQGVNVSGERVQYLSTELTTAKFTALEKATADARRRADTIARGLGGHLGAVKNVQLGVYQITPRNSTEVSDYGINDTSSRLKDVGAVVTVTFRVER